MRKQEWKEDKGKGDEVRSGRKGIYTVSNSTEQLNL